MNEDNYTGFERRPGAAEICARELSRLRHVFLSLSLLAVIHGYHGRVDLRCPPKENACRAFCSPIKYQLSQRNIYRVLLITIK